MRMLDLVRIALKDLRGKWMVLPALCIAVSMFCFCFAGTVLATVEHEKSMPCELIIMSEGSNITDNTIVEISEIPDVLAVTPILKVPMNIQVDAYSTKLTLIGIDNGYLDEEFSQWGIFPEDSVMPYIVLNHGACKLFEKLDKNDGEINEPKIDWLSEDITLHEGEGSRKVTSKISGILLENEEHQEPTGYISLSSAKKLLNRSGQSTEYIEAKVRIKNIGCSKSISNTLYTMGFNVSNTHADIQAKWDMQMKEMAYLAGVGILCVVCFLVLTVAWIKISMLTQKKEYSALLWFGARSSEIRWIYIIQALVISLIGIGIGVVVGIFLPSFISPELIGTSIFALAIPFEVRILSGAALIIFSIMLYAIVRNKLSPI